MSDSSPAEPTLEECKGMVDTTKRAPDFTRNAPKPGPDLRITPHF